MLVCLLLVSCFFVSSLQLSVDFSAGSVSSNMCHGQERVVAATVFRSVLAESPRCTVDGVRKRLHTSGSER